MSLAEKTQTRVSSQSSGFLGFNSKTTRTYDTQVQKSTIGASGTVDIYSNESISAVATDFISSGGKTTLHADKGRVDVSDLVVHKRVEQNKSSWWGLSKNSSDHKESYSIKPTLFSQSNDIDIISDQNDVFLKNVRVFTPKSKSKSIVQQKCQFFIFFNEIFTAYVVLMENNKKLKK